jgi:chemotaxis signal transduction protein
MSDAAAPRALVSGGRCFALPDGAVALPVASLRPVPLGGAGLLGIALVEGAAVPVLAPAPGLGNGPAWALAQLPSGRAVLAGEALLDTVPEEAEALPVLALGGRKPPPPMRRSRYAVAAPEARAVRGLPAALALELGGQSLVVPLALLETVLPMPALQPAGLGPAALGIAATVGGPVLVLDPAPLMEEPPGPERPTHLAIFRHAGRRLGLPCAQLRPAPGGGARLAAKLDGLLPALGAALEIEAPAPTPAEPMRALLVCEAAGATFAVPVEEVEAAIPPVAPSAAPAGAGARLRGVVAHRGEVLPVLDGGERLGRAPVLAGPGREAPMLRLALPSPVALAVDQVNGLRQVPERLIVATDEPGPAFAIATVGEQRILVCHAAALAEGVA